MVQYEQTASKTTAFKCESTKILRKGKMVLQAGDQATFKLLVVHFCKSRLPIWQYATAPLHKHD